MDEQAKLLRRIKIVKGQLDGIVKMMERGNVACVDIFTQIKASKQGLDNLGKELIKSRLKQCLLSKDKKSIEEIDELIKVIS